MGLENVIRNRLFIVRTTTGPNSPVLHRRSTWFSPRPTLSCYSYISPKYYATSNDLGGGKAISRKQVTVRNDDGRVQWQDLTVGEKAARTTQQTFNLGIILLGLGMTVRSYHVERDEHESLLTFSGLALSISYIPRSSHQIARLGTSIVLLTE